MIVTQVNYDNYLNDFNSVTLEIDGSTGSNVINMPTFREMVGLDSTDKLSDAGNTVIHLVYGMTSGHQSQITSLLDKS